jgi:hypothetical protein
MATTEMERRLAQLESSFSERIARLEEQVSRLSQQVTEAAVPPGTAWWKRIVGVFQDDPEFEEAMRLGRAYRESLRPKDDETAVESG